MPHKLIYLTWKYKYILLFFVLFYLLLTQRFLNDKTNGLASSIASDGTGYYYYLPASIIYHEFGYSFYNNPKNNIKSAYRPYLGPYINNTTLNRYYSGTAICLLPFFLSACLVSKLAGTPVNGYTDTFLLFVSLASLVYFLLAVLLILNIGKYFYISPHISFLLCNVFLFGTNLIHYVIQEPSLSHIYSFFAICLFFYLLVRLIQEMNLKNLILLALSLGLIVLIRPPNIIVLLFIPFFFDSFSSCVAFFKNLFQGHFKAIFIAFILFLACVFIQLIFYYIQTGDFFVISYPGQNFDFEDPELFNILFSYRKGLFVYAPIILGFLLFCLFAKGKWNKKSSLLVTFCVFVYFTSSWWCWTYGGGFGNRPFVDIYPLILISVLYFVNNLSSRSKKVGLVLCLPFVFFNQVMAYQYSHRLMDTYGNTTEENYWDIFMRTNMAEINRNKVKRHLLGKAAFFYKINTFEDTTSNGILVSPGYQSQHSCLVGEKNNFTNPVVFSVSQIGTASDVYVKADCLAKADKKGGMLGLVISVTDADKTISWDVTFFNQFEEFANGWKHMSNITKIDKFDVTKQSNINIMAFSTAGTAQIDDLQISIYKSIP